MVKLFGAEEENSSVSAQDFQELSAHATFKSKHFCQNFLVYFSELTQGKLSTRAGISSACIESKKGYLC